MSKDKKKSNSTKVKLAKRTVRTLGKEDLAKAAGATGLHCLTNSGRPLFDNDGEN
jgi:hypothetical protein